MGYLEKNFLLHERGTNEQLLPIPHPIILDDKEFTVDFIPFCRAEILEVSEQIRQINDEPLPAYPKECTEEQRIKIDQERTKLIYERMKKRNELWENFILAHIARPKFTREETLKMKPIYNEDGEPIDFVQIILFGALKEVSGMKFSTVKEEENEIKNS